MDEEDSTIKEIDESKTTEEISTSKSEDEIVKDATAAEPVKNDANDSQTVVLVDKQEPSLDQIKDIKNGVTTDAKDTRKKHSDASPIAVWIVPVIFLSVFSIAGCCIFARYCKGRGSHEVISPRSIDQYSTGQQRDSTVAD